MLKNLFAPAIVLGLVCSLLLNTSCAEGGGRSPEPPAVHEDLSPVKVLSQDDRIYFLYRTHFGFKPSELQRLNQMGYEAYLDWMLDLQPNAQLEADALATITDPNFPSTAELARWWQYKMIHNENPFQELLALFWHDHFATSEDVLGAQSRFWMFDHVNMWRENGTGNLRDLLYKMATDWTMLVWLDGYVSTRNAPNENFAREFWELFTLGADNGYTEADIQEASRAFTGYRRILVPDHAGPGQDRFVMVFQDNRHDNDPKTIFGKTVYGNNQAEYQDMVNLTLDNRPVAEFICRKIWEQFVYVDPSDDLINRLAKEFRASDYNLKALFKRIFLSEAFYSERARGGIIKSPVEHHIGFIRTTGLKITAARLDSRLNGAGQRPVQPPTVNGWPQGEFWLSSQGIVERANFLRDCIYYSHEAPQAGYDVGLALIPANRKHDAGVVDQLAWLLRVTLQDDQRQACIDYLNSDRNSGGVFSQPWDFDDPVQRNKKIRGLLYIMGQHPTYQIR